jgi:hypothetical protein
MQIDILVNPRGPIWDGKHDGLIDDLAVAIRKTVSREALIHITNLTKVFKNPTGNYLSHLIVERGFDRDTVTDQEIAYGPWLEIGGATGRANSGSFMGYHLWEQTFNHTEKVAQKIAQREVTKFMKKMGS